MKTHRNPTVTVPDLRRRRILGSATGALGAAGLSGAAYPFLASLGPSARARAEGGPVRADLSNIEAGTMSVLAWRGKPVWLLRRTPEMIAALATPSALLADPLSARSTQPASCVNATRSERPEWFVAVGLCTHLGCTPALRLDDASLNAELRGPGGFVCPCHGSHFDLAGRVVRDMPAPRNLDVPPYRFEGRDGIVVGQGSADAATGSKV